MYLSNNSLEKNSRYLEEYSIVQNMSTQQSKIHSIYDHFFLKKGK